MALGSLAKSNRSGIELISPTRQIFAPFAVARLVKSYFTATYNLAGYNYTLRDLGGGFAMLNGAVNVLDYVAEDYMVPVNYIKSFSVDETTGLPTISTNSDYSNVTGSGRITVVSK